jgi:serine/threonine protein phosphatase PrpC
MMITCPACAKENREEARYCRNCGSPLAAADEADRQRRPEAASIRGPAEAADASAQADMAAEPLAEEQAGEQAEAVEGPPLPLELPPGSVLDGRFRVRQTMIDEAGEALVEVEDLLECRSCQFVNPAADLEYCENCGARLEPHPRRHMTACIADCGEPGELAEDQFTSGGLILTLIPRASAEPAEAEEQPGGKLSAGYASDPGKRSNNEDSLISLVVEAGAAPDGYPSLGLFAVADGVGGHAGGEIASQAAIRGLARRLMETVFTPVIGGAALEAEDIETRLVQAVQQANEAILGLRSQEEHNDMGSTLTAALVCGGQAFIANLGDSRTYLGRAGKLEQVTQDHSLVARLAQEGLIRREQIYTHEQRNVIYRSLGEKADPQIDTFRLSLQPGDRLVLCSDGLWESLRDEMIEETLLANTDPQQASASLARLAKIAAGDDNISVIVVHWDGRQAAGEPDPQAPAPADPAQGE